MLDKFRTVLNILEYRSQQQPESTGYVFLKDGETEAARLTYHQLNQQALSIAAYLQTKTEVGDRVLLLYPSGLEFISAFFGCLYAGVVAVPAYPPKRNQKLLGFHSIVNNSGARVALTTASMLTERRIEQKIKLPQLKFIATDLIEVDSVKFSPQSIAPTSLAFLQYTSGSTGLPKGVMVTHENIIQNQRIIHQAFGHSEQTIGLGWLPLFHDMGLIGNVLQPLYLGFTCILMPPMAFLQKPIRWLKAISKYRVTSSGGPNFAYDLCVKKILPEQLANLDLSSWELAFNGAEPVRAQTLRQFWEKFSGCGFNYSAFYPCYGMAESTLFSTGGHKSNPPVIKTVKKERLEQNLIVEDDLSSSKSYSLVGCGSTYLDSKVIIVNLETFTCCEEKQVGEIWLSGSSIASGYWNRPEHTKETFKAYLKDNTETAFLRTGDLGYFSNGELFVTGRLKDAIIIRGRNHYPQDIELSVESSHPALRINSGAAFSVDVKGEEKLVVVQEIERSHLPQLNREEVIEAINKAVSLEHELAIETIVLLKPGSIDKTSSGKIQRHTSRQKFLDKKLTGVIVSQSLSAIEVNTTKNPSDRHNSIKTHELIEIKNEVDINNHENILIDNDYESSTKLINKNIVNFISTYLEKDLEQITSNSNFLGLGLDSIKAVELMDNLSAELNFNIDPNLIFEYPTIAELSKYLVKTYKIKNVNGLLVSEREAQKLENLTQKDIAVKSNNNNYFNKDGFRKKTRVTGEL